MSIKGINFKTKIWPCLTVFSSPDLVSVLDIFLSQTAIYCTRISWTLNLLIFYDTQHLIWCNYCFLNVLYFEHNILFSDFGSWISLVELNLGTNQLSRLPGMLSWVYDYITSTYGKNHDWTTVFIWVYRSLELLWVYLTSLCGEHCFKKLANLQPSFEMFSIKFD